MQPLSDHVMRGLTELMGRFADGPEPPELGPAQRVPPREISQRATDRVLTELQQRSGLPGGLSLAEVVSETLFHEQQRLAHPEDPQRAEADRALYADIARALPQADAQASIGLARRLVSHYAEEIEGHFDARTYTAATRAIPAALTLLLRGSAPSQVLQHFPAGAHALPKLDDQHVLGGRVESLRRLCQLGTVILTPTHQSHLDSPVIGYAIYRLGLPPFVYGAGLNLFTNPVLGFFMGRLGAYSVDRRKHDPLYREVLKAYATVSLELGQHHLFFPGGTRSRSGALETHLKKGLLGAGIAAFGNNLRANRPKPRVFIVPCTVSYPLVLEAESLAEDHLQREAAGRYIPMPDEAEEVGAWVGLLKSLLRLELRVHVRVGQALDPFGNEVDDEGHSRDRRGRPLDPAGYLIRDGRVAIDSARDAEYTRYLAEGVVKAFHRDNTVMATHVLAFAVLEWLRRTRPAAEPVRFLRALRAEARLPTAEVLTLMAELCQELAARAARGELHLDAVVEQAEPQAILAEALAAFGSFHTRPAISADGDALHVANENLVFFYRNHMEGYGLLGAPPMVRGGQP